MVSINPNLAWMIAGTFVALAIGTVIRWVALRNKAAEVVGKRTASLKVWWVLALLWSVAALLGKPGTTLLLAIASGFAMREYFRLLTTTTRIGRPAIAAVTLIGVIHFLLILFGATSATFWFFPISLLLIVAAVRSLDGQTDDYIRITGGLFWGGMLMIYGLSHSLFLFDIETMAVPAVGMVGWFLFVVVISEMNDIMQAIVGRKFGRHKITPQVSPHKTLEGLVGGLVSSGILAVLLAPYLTTITIGRGRVLGTMLSVLAGILISITGFLGDINMSAIKRDAGVKDGSNLLPGMGGMIDRIDSLTFTGPSFYYYVVLLQLTSN